MWNGIYKSTWSLMSLEGMHSSIKTVPENLEDDCDGEIAQMDFY